MPTARIWIWLTAAAVWLLPGVLGDRASAQEVAGVVEGRVLDASGTPLEAQIVVTGEALQGRRSTFTDRRGRFRVDLLPIGPCAITISALGHRPVTVSDVAVRLGGVTELADVRMEIQAVEMPAVTVVSARDATERRSIAIGGRLTRSELRSLPTDRDHLSIVALVPHADVSYFGDRLNLAGTTGPESSSYLEGLHLTLPPSNMTSTTLPYNLVEEVQVLTGGYEAEHGGAGGGLVNAVTAAGGNEIRGQFFGFFSERSLTTASGGPAVSTRTRDYGSYDVGGSMGLPLRRDRLWLFLAWNPASEREEVELPGFGIAEDLRRAQRFATKLSWKPTEKTSAVLVGIGDPSTRDKVGGIVLDRSIALGNLDPMLTRLRGGGWATSLRVAHVLGAGAALDVRAGLTRSEYSEHASTPRGASEPLYVDETGYVEGGVGGEYEGERGRSSAGATLTSAWGAHTLKTGLSFEDAFFEHHGTSDQVFRLTPGFFQYVTINDRRSANHTRVPTAFAQDSWPITDRLRMNAGLRWSQEYWMTSGGDLGQVLEGAWQPRLGLVWDADASGSSRVFASAGRFYQQTRLDVLGIFLQDASSAYLVRTYDHDPRFDPSGADTAFIQILGRQDAVAGLRGAAFDEYQLGFERTMGPIRGVVRGVQRAQRSGIVGAISPTRGQAVYGNPGHGELALYPEIERSYRALEISLATRGAGPMTFGASYVWSRSRGNYEGYWDQSAGTNDPVGAGSFMPDPFVASNTTGLLPGDRTHRFKLHASHPLGRGFAAGTTLTWSTGTPLSELTATPYGIPYYRFLQPRGSLGRSPSLYDLNVRVTWEPPAWAKVLRPRLIVDAFHVGNPRRPVFVDQVHYLGVDTGGQPTSPNPNYLKPLFLQPPVAYRFGAEVDW